MANNITVIDSIMGSGKTSWAIDYINGHPDESVVFVTPFLSEVERIKQNCDRVFFDPQPWGHSKRDDFNRLLEEGRDIVTTHATFSRSNSKTVDLLRDGNYTLIIDEAVDPLISYNDACIDNIKPADIKLLIDEGFIRVGEDNKVEWIKPDYEGSKYWKVAHCAKNGNLFYLDKTFLAWQFPPVIFDLFRNIFLLTYMFDGCLMYPFFQAHGIQYTMKSVYRNKNGDYYLSDYSDNLESRKAIADLITIFDDRMKKSMFDYRSRSLSKSWFDRADKKDLDKLKNNLRSFLRSVGADRGQSRRIMWTAYKEYKKALKGGGYTITRYLTEDEKRLKGEARKQAEEKTQCYVSCNSRATNNFADRDILAYMINLFPPEYIARYYTAKQKEDGSKVVFDRDRWALSNMVQWVFRSAVREGKPITIYIPSERMRKLFLGWLNPETADARQIAA